MRQRKGATIIINEEPNKEVARREQSKEGMMGGWYGFVRKVSTCTTTAKGKKRVGNPDGVVLYSTPEVQEVFLAQLVFLGSGLRRLASGPAASAAAARAVPARPASSPGSAIVAR